MRALASLANDKAMIEAYENNVDIYATVASLIYKNKVEDNLEFRPITGELQPEGKVRRANAKTVALGLNYGMSTKSLAERLNESVEEAQKVVDGYYSGLAGVKKYTDASQQMLKEKGYVTDAYGRRRHLPDGQLPEYEIKPLFNTVTEFNPLIGAIPHNDSKVENLIKSYQDRLSKATNYRDRMSLIDAAKKDNLEVKNNSGFISRAMRQCLNARIQGTSASMTKLAMIMARNDPELKKLGFRLLVTVHDEMYGEAPKENSEKVAKRLSEVMNEAARTKCDRVPWKTDPYVVSRWYADEFSAEVLKDYLKSKDLDKIKNKYSYINPIYIEQMCNETFDPNSSEEI